MGHTRGICADCTAPTSMRTARWCRACYTARRQAGTLPVADPPLPPDPPGPVRCRACGQRFRTVPVWIAHHYWLTPRCLGSHELARRGWRQGADGAWAFPPPERIQAPRGTGPRVRRAPGCSSREE